ncbi:MAG: sulfatase-like hydrolase/transferase [Gammaproteobacteria bacterium]|nr:sulfatase-like hydrolase/transferase [Gammaproteobacteria bacterium]
MPKPNIVLFFPDQHRGDAMACSGNPVVQTPNLDRLAGEGVLFDWCCTSSPLCMPARASLITGQPVNVHGVWGNNLVEADRFGPSHVRSIRDAGYRTAMIGKTHLYANHRNDGHTREHAHKLEDWGYQDIHELRDVVPSERCSCHYADFLAERGRLRVYQDYTRLWWTNAFRGAQPWEDPPSPLPTEEHIDLYCATQAATWIRDYDAQAPFYLQVCFTGPHTPFDAPPDFRSRYRPEDVAPPILDAPADPVSPQVAEMLKSSRLDAMTEMQARMMVSHYYAKVSLVDHGVGMVLDALADKGILDDTWIVYTSDHGEMLGDHRLKQKKVFYEGALNVPLIVRPPGGVTSGRVRGPARRDDVADHLDVCATLLEAAGAAPLAESLGRPLVFAEGEPALSGHNRNYAFSEVESYYSMARDERYKMTVDSAGRVPVELYDMREDPRELRNLVDDPGHKTVRERFLDEAFTELGFDDTNLDAFRDRLAAGPYRDTFARDLLRQFN